MFFTLQNVNGEAYCPHRRGGVNAEGSKARPVRTLPRQWAGEVQKNRWCLAIGFRIALDYVRSRPKT